MQNGKLARNYVKEMYLLKKILMFSHIRLKKLCRIVCYNFINREGGCLCQKKFLWWMMKRK